MLAQENVFESISWTIISENAITLMLFYLLNGDLVLPGLATVYFIF